MWGLPTCWSTSSWLSGSLRAREMLEGGEGCGRHGDSNKRSELWHSAPLAQKCILTWWCPFLLGVCVCLTWGREGPPAHPPEAPRLSRSAWALGTRHTYLFTTSCAASTSILSSSPDQTLPGASNTKRTRWCGGSLEGQRTQVRSQGKPQVSGSSFYPHRPTEGFLSAKGKQSFFPWSTVLVIQHKKCN